MKKVIILCVASAVLGAVLALVLRAIPDAEPQSLAQQPPGSEQISFGNHGVEGQAAGPGPSLSEDPSVVPLIDANGLTAEGRVNVAVYRAVNRSVVNITTKGVAANRFLMIAVPSEGEGSGTVIDREGHVLTNYHVVDGARDIRVTLFDGTTYEGKMVGHDPVTDVAVVKINAPPDALYPVTFGDSARLQVGEPVFAIGNPFGLERTFTTGVVSSLDRSLPSRTSGRTIKSIIQIDAAINPGSSGGPLLNARAQVVGMNTAIASSTGESIGVGFAIPINTIARVVPELIRNGRVVRADIGIDRVSPTEHGVLVVSLVPGGPAEQAGLQGFRVGKHKKRFGPATYEYATVDRSRADLIVGIDGKRVRTVDDLLGIIDSRQPGDQIVVTVFRGGREVGVPVRLAAEE